MHDPADADPAGLGERLQPGSDVHPLTEDVVLLGDHVPEVNPDPELDPLLRRDVRVPRGHSPLHLHGAPDGVNHAGELGQQAVAGVLHDPARVLGDLGIDQLTEMGLKPFVRPLLIRPHQARIPRHVGGEDRCEAADRGHDLSGGRVP
jgi:hypothetical protein